MAALSPAAQATVRQYTSDLNMGPYSILGCLTAALPWVVPTAEDFEAVGRVRCPSLMPSCVGTMRKPCITQESEYAAWTLTNGYALNHTTISVHRLRGLEDINTLNAKLQEAGVRLNTAGGVLKVCECCGMSLYTKYSFTTR